MSQDGDAKPKGNEISTGRGLAIIGAAVVAFAVYAKCTAPPAETLTTAPKVQAHEPQTDARELAWAMCLRLVEDRLKSPGTADYGPQRPADIVTPLGEGRYQCRGWVDSQNGFGALVRSDFELTVRDDRETDDSWALEQFSRLESR